MNTLVQVLKVSGHKDMDTNYMSAKNTTLEKTTDQENEHLNLSQLRKAIDETEAEDTVLGNEILELLKEIEIRPETFPEYVKESLKDVSMILKEYGLSDVDETSLLISMERKTIHDKKRQLLERESRTKYRQLLDKHSILQKELCDLKGNVSCIVNSIAEMKDEIKNDDISCKSQTTKLDEYNELACKMETGHDNLDMKKFEPKKLLDKYRRFITLNDRLVELEQTLAPYSDLPPNLLQARALLNSKEMEYKQISEQFLSASLSNI
ncbi:uncharacterized protein [Neodiprion pinetum]|uniref:Uncharacterized protein LOC107222905 isoform X1 n=2 Tax=Neodiprion lecontei TaxID=441921 RepID=A0ABM3GPH0_NEOLC|nr:uncharacterized protein LOC124223988 isoform X1 [Neodiprion pinetum]XP_046602160.1 uncharacterized protein LOC107222905 isoform X1 [Neodiprion lecontei]